MDETAGGGADHLAAASRPDGMPRRGARSSPPIGEAGDGRLCFPAAAATMGVGGPSRRRAVGTGERELRRLMSERGIATDVHYPVLELRPERLEGSAAADRPGRAGDVSRRAVGRDSSRSRAFLEMTEGEIGVGRRGGAGLGNAMNDAPDSLEAPRRPRGRRRATALTGHSGLSERRDDRAADRCADRAEPRPGAPPRDRLRGSMGRPERLGGRAADRRAEAPAVPLEDRVPQSRNFGVVHGDPGPGLRTVRRGDHFAAMAADLQEPPEPDRLVLRATGEGRRPTSYSASAWGAGIRRSARSSRTCSGGCTGAWCCRTSREAGSISSRATGGSATRSSRSRSRTARTDRAALLAGIPAELHALRPETRARTGRVAGATPRRLRYMMDSSLFLLRRCRSSSCSGLGLFGLRNEHRPWGDHLSIRASRRPDSRAGYASLLPA